MAIYNEPSSLDLLSHVSNAVRIQCLLASANVAKTFKCMPSYRLREDYIIAATRDLLLATHIISLLDSVLKICHDIVYFLGKTPVD